MERKMPSVSRSTESIASLKAAPYNPRKISSKALDGLKASLERWGVVQDVVVNRRTGYIVGGHQRVAALKAAGVKEVPVCWVDLDESEEKALNVALNNPHISGEFDETLQELLAEIQESIGPEAFEQVGLDGLLDDDALTGVVPLDSLPLLPDEDRGEFQQMTFTLHDTQVELVKEAIAASIKNGPFTGPNENKNGNALAMICAAFLSVTK